MAIFQLHLASHSRVGTLQFKEGDIISAHDFDHIPGNATKKQYFIVNVDFGDSVTTRNDARKFMVSHFVDGSFDSMSTAAKEAENRFNLAFADLDDLAQAEEIVIDWGQVASNAPYQPLYDAATVFLSADLIKDKFTDAKASVDELKAVASYGNQWRVSIQFASGTFQAPVPGVGPADEGTPGELLAFTPSGATAQYYSDNGSKMDFYVMSGVPKSGDLISGDTSKAQATIGKIDDEHATGTTAIGPG